ncbi:MAG: hypothetical protein IJZ84_05375 [Lachnospiraceae bacterium]|nr:hypothetical protein [Lachnospiraceae bacterium]
MQGMNKSKKQDVLTYRRRISGWKILLNFVVAIGVFLGSFASIETLAYVFSHSTSVENTFTEAHVTCEVMETFNGTIKEDVYIQNTSNISSYIRAAVVVTWMSEDGTKVTAAKPVDDTDYVIKYADEYAKESGNATNWIKGSDGYWYYTVPVNAGGVTQNLIENCSLKEGVTPPDGFYLSVEIVASAIQATPTYVVTDQWSSGVSGVNGTTLQIKTE